jgi:hypothetical protein
LCDEVGLYVVDEANVEVRRPPTHHPIIITIIIIIITIIIIIIIVKAHGALPMGRFAMDPMMKEAMVGRAGRMALRDKNHASIIVWYRMKLFFSFCITRNDATPHLEFSSLLPACFCRRRRLLLLRRLLL